jgi:hypothetical protein
LFVLSLNESEFRLGSGLAPEECEDCCFRAGHVALTADGIATDQFINDGRRHLMLGERINPIPRTALVNDQEIEVSARMVGQVAVRSDLHDSARSGVLAANSSVAGTAILAREVIAVDSGFSHVSSFLIPVQ